MFQTIKIHLPSSKIKGLILSFNRKVITADTFVSQIVFLCQFVWTDEAFNHYYLKPKLIYIINLLFVIETIKSFYIDWILSRFPRDFNRFIRLKLDLIDLFIFSNSIKGEYWYVWIVLRYRYLLIKSRSILKLVSRNSNHSVERAYSTSVKCCDCSAASRKQYLNVIKHKTNRMCFSLKQLENSREKKEKESELIRIHGQHSKLVFSRIRTGYYAVISPWH